MYTSYFNHVKIYKILLVSPLGQTAKRIVNCRIYFGYSKVLILSIESTNVFNFFTLNATLKRKIPKNDK